MSLLLVALAVAPLLDLTRPAADALAEAAQAIERLRARTGARLLRPRLFALRVRGRRVASRHRSCA